MRDNSTIEEAFVRLERRLWSLGYRITGVAADADELVQETFARALHSAATLDGVEAPDLDRWLLRVATNLAIDCLRRRRRQEYPGTWLPSPVETAAPDLEAKAGDDVEARYERAEQVSYAFLVALEALAPRARAALLLTDVLDCSAAEVADLLGTSEGNVRVLHHRARRALAHVDVERTISAETRARQGEALARLVLCMAQQDAAGLEAILTDDVRSLTDGGGVYTALRAPLAGRDRVIRFHLETARRRASVSITALRWMNGSPALVVLTRPLQPQMAPRLVLRCEVDREGRIRELHTILAPAKLTAVNFSPVS